MLAVLSFTFSALLTSVAGTQFNAEVKQHGSFLKPVEYQHRLRLCNAYPGAEVFRVEKGGQNLTSRLAYKECQQVASKQSLRVGDRLNFVADQLPMSSFTVDALPQYDAMLYIVVQRQDAKSDAVAFQSHLFASSRNAQVAVMDTYVGKAKAALLLVNASGYESSKEGPGYTVMPFGTAFGVADGNYQVILSDGSAESKIHSPMQAKEGESYLVLRTGAGLAGKGSEMDLMVFPSPSWAERSAAKAWSLTIAFLAALFISMM
ncbi:unnamed protein product [Cladocopium goreaui]|uniref:EF-hand domain-containing protein n=1 Tax=Cladocopium goreaui TaxID=2562237 RepID=A0A9P1BIR8_9DINO|nr:unnamed protein product [Cladocopium goreaui]